VARINPVQLKRLPAAAHSRHGWRSNAEHGEGSRVGAERPQLKAIRARLPSPRSQ